MGSKIISVFCFGIIFSVSVVKCEIEEDSYNVISTMINSPVRPIKGIHNKLEIDNTKLNTLSELETEDNIDPMKNDVTGSNTVKKDEAVLEEITESPDPEEEISQNIPETETERSAVKDGFRRFRKIYDACNKKINKRINKLLKTKVNVKTNTEKDLFELREYVISLYKCFKVSSFRYLDDVLNGDVIPVSDYVEFVKDGRNGKDLKDSPVINIIPFLINGKLSFHNHNGSANETISSYASSILKNDWNTLILERFGKLLHTHSLKFRIDEAVVEGRGRRRRDHRMFAMMVMGFMIMASILIPMGFQFLTVLGGKSLLMAKMALIMSAINGLKKIATSHVGYGFYHTAPDGYHHEPHHHHHGFHEKVYQVKPDESHSPFRIAI